MRVTAVRRLARRSSNSRSCRRNAGGRLVVESLGLEPDGPLTDADFAGLPMPDEVWDNETTFD